MEDSNLFIQNIPLNQRHTIADNVVEDITKETYEFMPVESFGKFLITKMGFDEKVGIGKKNQIVRPIEFVPRNHRQGLGADPMPSFLQKQKDGKKISKELQNLVSKTGKSYNFIGDKLIDKNRPIEQNDKVKIISGKHKDLEGIVTRLDKDKEEYLVELKNGQNLKVLKQEIQLIFEEGVEAGKLSQRNNKKDNNYSHSSSGSRSKSQSSEESQSDSRSRSREKKKIKKAKKEKKSKKDKKKKLKKLKWVEPHTRVRIISKKYKGGLFYNVKVIISDIIDRYTFTAITLKKQILEDLREKEIETVMPELQKKVKVVIGEQKGYIATLIERNKRKNEVVIQIADTLETIVLSQDDVSEYVG